MNGILVINKEKGYTSRDVVNIVSKTFQTKKVGHAGTLDPMASGILVICLGSSLKMMELLTNHDKEYIAGITLGIETDTLDMEGNILRKDIVNVEENKIREVVKSFKGSYLQEVPKYSAIKVKGKKLYEYARNNITVELPKRMVNIYDIELVDNVKYENGLVFFKIKCCVSKGTYIRSLVRDIGNKLGVCAVMNSLVRTRLGNFKIEDSYSIEDVKAGNFKFSDFYESFKSIPKIKVSDEVSFKIKNGMIMEKFFDSEMAFILDMDDNLLAIYKNEDDKARVYKMF